MITKKILFISSNQTLLDYAQIYLNRSDHNFYFDSVTSISDATLALEESNNLAMIYLGHKISKDEPLKNLSNALVPIINEGKVKIFGTNKALKDRPWATYFNELTSGHKIMLEIYKSMGLQIDQGQYISMPILALLSFDTFPFPCYVEKNGQKDLVFNINEEVHFEQVNELREDGIEHFFVKISELESIITKFENSLKQNGLDIDDSNREEVKESAIEFSMELLNNCGIDIQPQHKQLTQDAFKNIQNLIKNTRKDKAKFKELVNKNDLFYYKHITMCSLMCCFILDEMHLTDSVLKEKLCLASNLQNIILENDNELKITENEQLVRFAKEDQKRIKEHAFLAANALESNEKIDLDILKIIKEQHGDKLGKSFQDKISSTSKLSLIFQLASQFATKYLILQEHYDDSQIDVVKIFTEIHERLETKDKSLIKALKEVMLSI